MDIWEKIVSYKNNKNKKKTWGQTFLVKYLYLKTEKVKLTYRITIPNGPIDVIKIAPKVKGWIKKDKKIQKFLPQ